MAESTSTGSKLAGIASLITALAALIGAFHQFGTPSAPTAMNTSATPIPQSVGSSSTQTNSASPNSLTPVAPEPSPLIKILQKGRAWNAYPLTELYLKMDSNNDVSGFVRKHCEEGHNLKVASGSGLSGKTLTLFLNPIGKGGRETMIFYNLELGPHNELTGTLNYPDKPLDAEKVLFTSGPLKCSNDY